MAATAAAATREPGRRTGRRLGTGTRGRAASGLAGRGAAALRLLTLGRAPMLLRAFAIGGTAALLCLLLGAALLRSFPRGLPAALVSGAGLGPAPILSCARGLGLLGRLDLGLARLALFGFGLHGLGILRL